MLFWIEIAQGTIQKKVEYENKKLFHDMRQCGRAYRYRSLRS